VEVDVSRVLSDAIVAPSTQRTLDVPIRSRIVYPSFVGV
jgi:hypothetical protein